MMKMAAALLVLVAVAAPPAAQKVYVDDDPPVDRHKYRAFAWGELPPSVLEAKYPLVHSFIENSIEYELTGGGPIEETTNPDLYITYCTNSKEWVQVLVQAYGSSYGPGRGWDSLRGTTMITGSTQVNTWRKGTLIIDICDAHTKMAA